MSLHGVEGSVHGLKGPWLLRGFSFTVSPLVLNLSSLKIQFYIPEQKAEFGDWEKGLGNVFKNEPGSILKLRATIPIWSLASKELMGGHGDQILTQPSA